MSLYRHHKSLVWESCCLHKLIHFGWRGSIEKNPLQDWGPVYTLIIFPKSTCLNITIYKSEYNSPLQWMSLHRHPGSLATKFYLLWWITHTCLHSRHSTHSILENFPSKKSSTRWLLLCLYLLLVCSGNLYNRSNWFRAKFARVSILHNTRLGYQTANLITFFHLKVDCPGWQLVQNTL